MDQHLRNALRNRVGQLRSQLLDSVHRQLEGSYGIVPDTGEILSVEDVPPLTRSDELLRQRKEIEAAIQHEEALLKGSERTQRAVEIFSLEAAFTLLNRLAALKVLERRGLVEECLGSDGAGNQSSAAGQAEPEALRVLRQLAPEVAGTDVDRAYRTLLELLFDDLASEVQLLFSRSTPHSHLFPRGTELKEVLAVLNDPEIEAAWDEDEVLGWVYQYFTPKELREKVREESSAPRNTYELAIRNQFYTPDYVVRFLAENTLGRLWWEMYPQTSLKDRDYFVRRPDEVPDSRAPKDPRELQILDPACGSGHFLHYCFEILQTIYDEAYSDSGCLAGDALREDYPDADAFQRAVPGLILERNLYGIDIDYRAVQLTALSLYLRAKRAHPDSTVRRVNALHAAPMPGETGLFEEFLEQLSSTAEAPILRQLLREIFAELGELAGEAGSLLRPERRLQAKIDELRTELAKDSKQLGLGSIRGEEGDQPELEMTSRPSEEFWEALEGRLFELLAAYADQLSEDGIAPRLFAEDAAHGIGFLDSLLRKYDVVLMNPPFGAASKNSKKYIDNAYPRTKNDLYAAFVERGLELLEPLGYLGAITSRTGFFLTSFQKWREEILLKETDVITFADLGYGVLDTAMVETAAYVLRKRR
ncbi:Eco57I restriction-modification methylase domain-containing protein [Gemmatimonadota bacterium]